MQVFKFNLTDLKRMREGNPHEYLCFTISRMVEGKKSVYPRSEDVIEKFRQLVPEAFSNRPYHGVGIILAYLKPEFRNQFRTAEDGSCRDALVNMALEKHGDIELQFDVDACF